MTITGTNKPSVDEPGSIDGFSSFGNMNIEDFMLSEDGIGNGGPSSSGFQQQQPPSLGAVSGSTTPHYNPSPAPSGTSTPGLVPSSHNVSNPFSPAPASVSANSPRPIHSPMVMPPPSPNNASQQQQSRSESTHSAMGVPPVSPYGQPVPSPQMNPQQGPAMMGVPHMTPPSNPMIGIRLPPLTPPVSQPSVTPPVNRMPIPMGGQPNRMPPVHQQHPMAVGEPPIITQPMKRAPNPGNRFPMMPVDPRMMQPMRPMHMMRANLPMNHMNHPKPHFTKNPGYKIYEFNRRLQERGNQDAFGEGAWWDYFVGEFFEETATLTLSLCLEDGPKNFFLSRTLIPRFFRSFFDGGAIELYLNLRQSKEWFQNNVIMVDSEQCAMETLYVNPMYTKVISEGRLMLEFSTSDAMRIRSWHFVVRGWQEQIPRSVLAMHAQQQNPVMLQQWTANITRQGFPNTTLNYLRLCCILQPMQQLMTMHKTTGADPRDCLKTSLVQKWQKPEEPAVTPPVPVVEEPPARPAPKQRKKRKNAADKETGNSRKKRSPEPTNTEAATQQQPPISMVDQAEVMVVGEPSLMGGGLGKDDERVITRIENMPYAVGNGAVPHNLQQQQLQLHHPQQLHQQQHLPQQHQQQQQQHHGPSNGASSGNGPSGADTSWSLDDVLLSDFDDMRHGEGNPRDAGGASRNGMNMGQWPH